MFRDNRFKRKYRKIRTNVYDKQRYKIIILLFGTCTNWLSVFGKRALHHIFKVVITSCVGLVIGTHTQQERERIPNLHRCPHHRYRRRYHLRLRFLVPTILKSLERIAS